MRFIRKSTATKITVGPFKDVTDGYTPELSLTATNEHITLVVDVDGVPTLVIDTNATSSGGDNDMEHVTGDDAGFYTLELTAVQTGYIGRAILSIDYITTHRGVSHEFMIISENMYDSLLDQDCINVNVAEISSDATAADNCEAFFDGNGYTCTGCVIPTVTSSGLSSAAVDAIWDELKAGHAVPDSFGDYLNYPITGIVNPTGTGTLEVTYNLTLTDNSLPIANARVWVSTDSAHAHVVASDTTDAFGVVNFNLDPGTYYFWRYKSGVNFTNPLQGTFSVGVQSASGTGTLVDTITTARIKTVTYAGSI